MNYTAIKAASSTPLLRNRTVVAIFRQLRRPLVALSLIVACLVIACAVAPGLIAPLDPYKQGLLNRLAAPSFISARPNAFLLGADPLGRDTLSRIIHGARMTMIVSFGAVLVAASLGAAMGLAAGYLGGLVDAIILRVIDMVLAFPIILLVIAMVTVVGNSVFALICIMGLASAPGFARVVRSQVRQINSLDFVDAARAIGARPSHIVTRHIIPNILSPFIVFSTFELSKMILIEATLSFLGIGIQPPTPTWGGMISDGQQYLMLSWYASFFPGLAIASTILATNTLGDALRDALDPRSSF